MNNYKSRSSWKLPVLGKLYCSCHGWFLWWIYAKTFMSWNLLNYWIFMQLTIFILVAIRNIPLSKQDGNARTNSIHTMIYSWSCKQEIKSPTGVRTLSLLLFTTANQRFPCLDLVQRKHFKQRQFVNFSFLVISLKFVFPVVDALPLYMLIIKLDPRCQLLADAFVNQYKLSPCC
jgi:hypothetical protein